VPLAYACAIAAITARGILVKSGSAIDALAACKTIALDKTGTITTGSLNLAEGFVITPGSSSSSSSSSSSGGGSGAPVHVRAMQGLAELCKKVAAAGSSSSSSGGALGTVTSFSSSSSSGGASTSSGAVLDSDDYSLSSSLDDVGAAAGSSSSGGSGGGTKPSFDSDALKCAVALSRLSNHPVSRAMVESAPHVDGDVSVLSFEQVRKGGQALGFCRMCGGAPLCAGMHACFVTHMPWFQLVSCLVLSRL
jgi:hypothetical protein